MIHNFDVRGSLVVTIFDKAWARDRAIVIAKRNR
jgi:hypothetical protein